MLVAALSTIGRWRVHVAGGQRQGIDRTERHAVRSAHAGTGLETGEDTRDDDADARVSQWRRV